MSTPKPPQAPGTLSLSHLLKTIDPHLYEDTYIFLSFPHGTPVPPTISPFLSFEEPEGKTIVTSIESAKVHQYLTHQSQSQGETTRAPGSAPAIAFESKCIRLDVQSSLEAVGFLAVVTRELAAKEISTNAVSAFYHDYLFVPEGKEEEAMLVLKGIKEAAERNES